MPASKLIKPWSISTTVRNPERLRGFLSVLAELDWEVWNHTNQERFQIILIQRRQYGAHNTQFLAGLDPTDVKLLNGDEDIPVGDAERIFHAKGYVDPAMRGRTSFKPLEKLGFTRVNPDNHSVQITASGHELLNPENDIGDIILRSMLKWQLPNPIEAGEFPAKRGYSVKPFVATLHLIDRVNRLCGDHGLNATGLSFDEFDAFVPTLIKWEKIDEVAQKVVDIRVACQGLTGAERESKQQTLIYEAISEFDRKHLRDYGDNARRYFRLTRLIRYRGNGRFVDLEPRRAVEIESLLIGDSAQPQDFQGGEYQDYLCDPNLPVLPWQNYAQLLLIYEDVIAGIFELDTALALKLRAGYPAVADERILDARISLLRNELRDLQHLQEALDWQTTEKTREIAETFAGLSKPRACKPEELEFHTANALMSLDAAEDVVPNYPVGGDNRPTFTAPGGAADIECFYESFNVVCEVTLMRDSKQWVHEGYPVLRHLLEFAHSHEGTTTYGLFLAPVLHGDTIDVFWGGASGNYRGETINVFPLRFSKFSKILEACAIFRGKGGVVGKADVGRLFIGMATATETCPNSVEWPVSLEESIDKWCDSLLASGVLQ